MGRRAKPSAFGKAASGRSPAPADKRASGSLPVRPQAVPEAVASRMVRRIAVITGIPTLLGMAVFVASYLLVSRGILAIPPVVTLLASGACFLLGLLGLSFGVLSASWENKPGSLLGLEQLGPNLGRLRESVRALRQPAPSASGGPKG